MTKPRSKKASGSGKEQRKRDKQIALRVSESEYAAFRQRADGLDLALTTWIRLVCRRASGMDTP
jgi:predicted DNA binding CopG/RHH family protein